MSTTGASPLNLTKPESGDVVSLAVINTNYDTINSKAAAVDVTLASNASNLTTLNTAVGASGTVQNAVKATNVAGGLNRQIPYQSAVNTTTFTNTPAALGQVLTAGLSTIGWSYATPYRLEANAATGTGSISVTFSAAFGTGVVPILSCVASASTTPTIITVTSVSNTGFTIKVWEQQATSPYQFIAATGSRTVYWTAIQVSP